MSSTNRHYPRKLACLYTNETGARTACATLLEAGLPADHIELLCPDELHAEALRNETGVCPGAFPGDCSGERSDDVSGEAASLRLARSFLLGAATGLALGAVADAVLYIYGAEDFLRM